jgi:uncharacterized membrane protein YczE
VFGLFLCGTGISAMVQARLGLGPWDVLHQGLATRTGAAIGTVGIVVGALLLAVWIPLRVRPGIGTVVNVVVIGLVVNGWLAVAPAPDGMAARVLLLLAGMAVTAVGIGLYLGAGLGTGPRDGVMTGLARLGLPVWLARFAIEASAFGAGWALGGTVGVGTVVFVLAIGPLVHLSVDRFRLDPPGVAC